LIFGHPATSTIIVTTEGEAEVVLDVGAVVAELLGLLELLLPSG
jgi:hypothetical protein